MIETRENNRRDSISVGDKITHPNSTQSFTLTELTRLRFARCVTFSGRYDETRAPSGALRKMHPRALRGSIIRRAPFAHDFLPVLRRFRLRKWRGTVYRRRVDYEYHGDDCDVDSVNVSRLGTSSP